MRNVWWYLVGDSPQGPVSREWLDAMLIEGILTQESLVWTEGLSHWICVAELPPLSQHSEEPQAARPPVDRATAGTWRRFIARMLDLCLLSLLGMVLAQAVLPPLWPELNDWMSQPFAPYLLGWLLFPWLLLLEAGIFARFGNTPGKALLALEVATLDGQRLNARQYLRRQWGVFFYGFAMGLPVIFLIAMASQGLGLRNGDPAAYDAGKHQVFARRVERKHWLWGIAAVCAAIAAGLLLTGLRR